MFQKQQGGAIWEAMSIWEIIDVRLKGLLLPLDRKHVGNMQMQER
jgi:hypothetical protein